MSLDTYGYTHDIEVEEMEIVGTEIKGSKARTAVELQGGEVEDRTLTGITHDAGAALRTASLFQGKDIGIATHLLHHLSVGHHIGASPETQRVTSRDLLVGGRKGGHRVSQRTLGLVVALRREIYCLCRCCDGSYKEQNDGSHSLDCLHVREE